MFEEHEHVYLNAEEVIKLFKFLGKHKQAEFLERIGFDGDVRVTLKPVDEEDIETEEYRKWKDRDLKLRRTQL